ncbi:MAG: FeoB-associated Cys-rich membrane protein [Clostridiales bacterium]|nr:FeoB-associated Cys-rich membrane protein [Clostridiales bacterium]
MLEFLRGNIGNIIVIAIVALIVFLAIRAMVKNKKDGKSSCGCDCSGCALKDKCENGR